MVFCAVNYIRDGSFYDETTQSYVNGIRAYEMSEQNNNALADYLTEDYLTGLVKEIQDQKLADLDSEEAYAQAIRQKSDLLYLLSKNYMTYGANAYLSVLNDISIENGIGFYERRLEKVSDFLNADDSYGSYLEREKNYWMEKAQSVTTPFRLGDTSTMSVAKDLIVILFYLAFAVAVCISPMFASEYESGAAALLLTTKYGKTRLISAKITAAVSFAVGYVVLGIGMAIGTFNSYQFGSVVLSYLGIIVVVYVAVGVLSLLGIWKCNR
jgi:hypothetical protein